MLKNFFKYFALLLFVALTHVSCSEYQRVLKSTDVDYKYEMAMKYFGKKDYARAEPLFEELSSVWRGTKKSAEVYFNYAYCLYGQEQYILAGYHFKNFVKTYPKHGESEYAFFLTGLCYYNDSPVYSLDQASTYEAIDELQLFANRYPKSNYLYRVNELMQDLRDKLELKAFENAKLYLDLEKYKAAIIAFDNMLFDYPDTKHKEEALFLQVKAHYNLAYNSVAAKQEKRVNKALNECESYLSDYPEGKFNKDAMSLLKQIKKLKEKQSN